MRTLDQSNEVPWFGPFLGGLLSFDTLGRDGIAINCLTSSPNSLTIKLTIAFWSAYQNNLTRKIRS